MLRCWLTDYSESSSWFSLHLLMNSKPEKSRAAEAGEGKDNMVVYWRWDPWLEGSWDNKALLPRVGSFLGLHGVHSLRWEPSSPLSGQGVNHAASAWGSAGSGQAGNWPELLSVAGSSLCPLGSVDVIGVCYRHLMTAKEEVSGEFRCMCRTVACTFMCFFCFFLFLLPFCCSVCVCVCVCVCVRVI